MTRPPRQLIGHCGSRIIALITSGSCDDPSDRGTTRHRCGVIQPPPLQYPTGKRDSAYLYGRFSSRYLSGDLQFWCKDSASHLIDLPLCDFEISCSCTQPAGVFSPNFLVYFPQKVPFPLHPRG
ncbi:hypothetical protein AVEN_174275-1 [Araneus ventricosus]|uniref:Uncharacterized protein n=1 Tax=Araneus ventricosus TaxID=182803 RepID=A0A4Y2U545_ARAVE|nr:hypothetical protein AVEN_145257-1 [Araneus ventricosus]GBO06707.1 hypothetical protein AVEN_174275-1 [Araneus ventricosus]